MLRHFGKPACLPGFRNDETQTGKHMIYRVNNLIYAAGNDLHNTIRTRIAMTEPVNADALRTAADAAITRYPYFSVKLIRIDEEFALTSNNAPLTISSGGRAIPLGGRESGYHLLALAYDENLIYVDTSHFLTDGNGKFPFIKTLLYCYLHILHPEAAFDMTGIDLPGSSIPFDEADDHPFPENPVEAVPWGIAKRPEKVFLLDDQPAGYKSRDQWTSLRMKIKQKEMMKYLSSVDGSPASFIASVMYRVIDMIHPGQHLPIVCGMQHQYRKALGKPYSHLCHVNVVPIVFPVRMRGKAIDLLNTITRGIIMLRTEEVNDLLAVNAHVMNERKIQGLTLEEKHAFMKDYLIDGIGQNTFEVSYTGRVPFCGLEKYITDFTPILDMSLSGGISIEIFSLGEDFCVNIMQRNDDKKYADCFVSFLNEFGIRCVSDAPEHFEINDFVLPMESGSQKKQSPTV